MNTATQAIAIAAFVVFTVCYAAMVAAALFTIVVMPFASLFKDWIAGHGRDK